MYSYTWDAETGGLLLNSSPLSFSKEPRPVYYKELDILGFDRYWNYAKNDSYPYMWAEANNYSTEAGRLPRQKVGVFTQHLKLSFWMTQNQMDNLSALLISLQWLKRTGIYWRSWLRKQLKKYTTLM